jgi:hypothetical protein
MKGWIRTRRIIGWWSCASLFLGASTARAADWLPVAPEELGMTSEAKAPGAPAIYLYRQIDRDDEVPMVTYYNRIKVLNDAGRERANIVIEYNQLRDSVGQIEARTIRPDGTIVNFDGRIFDTITAKGHGVRMASKTLTLPGVEVGSIIEYRYRHYLDAAYVFDSKWLLADDLYTRHARFSLRPNQYFTLRWSWPMGLPPGTAPPVNSRGMVRLEVNDVPAFVTEEFMPPEDEIRQRVTFEYSSPEGNAEREPDAYWKRVARESWREIDHFVGNERAMKAALAEIVGPGDSPEQQLRKAYARVQQLRNLSFEREQTEQESKREHLADVKSAADILKRGYGNGQQLTWLMLALARAIGVDARPVLVPSRNLQLFWKERMNQRQLNENVVLVKLDGRDLFLDPGSILVPFGQLPWAETGVTAMIPAREGPEWIEIPSPPPAGSRVTRHATLALDDTGSVEGKLILTYTGLDAIRERRMGLNQDATTRRKLLEDEVQELVPVGCHVELVNQPQWNIATEEMSAEFTLRVPGWAQQAGSRWLLPASLFSGAERHLFDHADRVQPLYFSYMNTVEDNVSIKLPAGRHPASALDPMDVERTAFNYRQRATLEGSELRLERRVTVKTIMMSQKLYGTAREFYQRVRTGDERQVVLVSK